MFPGRNLIAGFGLVIYLGSISALPLLGQETPDEWPVLRPCAHLPQPQGCTDSILMDHFRRKLNTQFTPEGLLVLSFTVDTFGQIKNAEVLRDPFGQGKELLESLDQLPAWVPGMRNGLAVAVPFRIPIRVGGQADAEKGYTLIWGTTPVPPSHKLLKKKAPEALLVIGPLGDTLSPVQINASWNKGRRSSSITSPPYWNSKALRWLRGCPKGAQLEIEAIIGQGTRFLSVKNSWIMQP